MLLFPSEGGYSIQLGKTENQKTKIEVHFFGMRVHYLRRGFSTSVDKTAVGAVADIKGLDQGPKKVGNYFLSCCEFGFEILQGARKT